MPGSQGITKSQLVLNNVGGLTSWIYKGRKEGKKDRRKEGRKEGKEGGEGGSPAK